MKTKASLRQILLTRISVLMIVLLSFFVIFTYTYTIKNDIDKAARNMEESSEKLQELLKIPVWNFNYSLVDFMCELQLSNPLIEKIVLNINGTTREFGDRHYSDNPNYRVNIPKDLIYKNTYLGSLTIQYSLFPIYKETFVSVLQITLVCIAILIILSSAMLVMIKKTLLQPINFLQTNFKNVGSGVFSSVDESSVTSHELYEIASAYNQMVKELKDREHQLISNHELFYNIINSMPSPLIIFNKDFEIIHNNDLCANFFSNFGINFEDIKALQDIPFLRIHSDFINDFMNSSEDGTSIRERASSLSGVVFLNILIFKMHLEDADYVVLRLDDITEIEKKNQVIFQAQKFEMVGTLAGGLAHDFNNIIGIISSAISFIDMKLSKNELSLDESKKYLNMIKEASSRAAKLIQQLLTVARKTPIEKSNVDICSVLSKCIDLSGKMIDKSVCLKFNKQKESIIVNADISKIEQVLLNLIINAGHAMTIMRGKDDKWGGNLEVSLLTIEMDRFLIKTLNLHEGKYCEIQITDTGVGIKKDNIKKIFDPFFTTKQDKGTGLGLSMVKNIIESHGGYVKVYSEYGIGTTFSIYLPIAEGEEQVAEPIEQIMPDQLSGTILIVDDEDSIRETAKDICEYLGLQVIEAENGQIACEYYETHYNEIDVVLLDLVMPIMSGDKTITRLIEINPKVKVVMSSGFCNDFRIQQCMEQGAKVFIGKPYKVQDIYSNIMRVLNQD